MILTIKATGSPPEKPDWHSPDPSSRGDWAEVFSCITTWFCSSHDFNKNDALVITLDKGYIEMIGGELRYLGPSMRSAASLVHKAYQLLSGLDDNIVRKESTPGVWVGKHEYNYPEPHYQLVSSDRISDGKSPAEGTIFGFDHSGSKQYYAPGSRTSQAIVWYLQDR